MMKKKLMKMTKIFLVLTLIFSQLSSVTKVFADEITGNDTEIKDETKELVVNGYLMNTFDDSIINETENDGVFEYNVTAGKYRQILTISGDKIDDTKSYSVKVNDNDSVVMTGEELKNATIEGSEIDLTNSYNTIIEYTDKIVITEVSEETETEALTLEYKAKITYEVEGNSFDEALNALYEEYVFENGNFIVNAKELPLLPTVPTMEYLYSLLNENNGIKLEVFDRDNNLVTLEEETPAEGEISNNGETPIEGDISGEDTPVSETLIKNGYTLKFTKGLSEAIYKVYVMGDITDDSIFNTDDMIPTMEGYLNGEMIPTMDLYLTSHETEGKDEYEEDPFGTITIEDIMTINGYLNNSENERENTDLSLVFGSDTDELYVGDTFKVSLVVNSTDLEDYINGIDGLVTYSDNLKLMNVLFNENLIGTYNEDGRFVGAGTELTNGTTVITFEFMAINDGEGTVTLNGSVANDMVINEFEEVSVSVNITRKSSINNLHSLNASVGTFDTVFDKDVTVYTLTVPYDTKEVILSGSLEDTLSTVDGLFKYELTEDKTTAIITVIAEDGSTKVYTVYIIKEKPPVVPTPVVYYYSSNNYLKTLEAKGYEIKFDRDTLEYELSVKNDVKSLDITAIAEDSRSRVEITGNENFKTGKNTVIISVKAENGDVREYKLIVNRKNTATTTLTEEEESGSTAEKVVIIILIVLVVLGLLYLIFKKDDDATPTVKPENKKNNTKNNSKK